jgi:hypothetical protein
MILVARVNKCAEEMNKEQKIGSNPPANDQGHKNIKRLLRPEAACR